jgi:hypothetical protein
MGVLPKLGRLGASLFLLFAFWVPGRTDTRVYEFPPPDNLCTCVGENKASAHRCTPHCSLERCEGEGPDTSTCQGILQNPKPPGSSDRPARSRPAYSRKSNRTQRAQL